MVRLLLTVSLLLLSRQLVAQELIQLSGYVSDANSSETLIGATLYHPESGSGAATNEYGFYSLSLPKQDSLILRVSYVGYQTRYLKLAALSSSRQDIALYEEALLQEVEVVASEPSAVEESQMSRISVPIATIKTMPALLGEVDILKTLQLLPGIQSGSEGSSGLYVRGGGPDQNLILLDGVPVYNASHLFGFFSVFNADAVKHVDVYKGGFPARYGGRLSSVLDIRMKEGNRQEWHGAGGIGLISSRFTIEGPLQKDRASMMISGRRTYIDILARPLIQAQTDDDEVVGYYFYDLNTKFNYRLDKRNHVFASAYLGDDKFYSRFRNEYQYDPNTYYKSEQESGIRWGNITSSLRWNHIFSNRLFANTTLTYSKYQFRLFNREEDTVEEGGEVEQESINADYISFIRDFALKFDLDYTLNNRHLIKSGLLAMQHRFRPGAFQYTDNETDITLGQPALDSWELQAYAEDDWMVNKQLKLNLGLHTSTFLTRGKNYASLQPRLSARYLLRPDLSFKASWVSMRQYIHLLTNSGIGLPTDLWVPSTSRVKPQRSWQAAIGAVKELTPEYRLSLEGYYKKMTNLIEYREAASYFDLESDWQEQVTRGQGSSYGAELFLEKHSGVLSGWLGYTLSWANRTFDELNFGQTYPYKYDRRHDLSLVMNYQPSKRSVLSASWVYGTGNAITLPLATYGYSSDQNVANNQGYYDEELTYYSQRNDFRMQAYHRMDLSYSRIKKVKWGERRWVFSVYNLYNRKNPFYINLQYDYDTDSNKFVQYSLFGIIPSVSYNFTF